MKQMSAGNGWALINNHLYWTQNDGAKWTEITPPGSTTQRIEGVFFLDSSNGWVSLVDWGPPPGALTPVISLASTGDGGRSWKLRTFDTSAEPHFRDGTTNISIRFLNARRGWILFPLQSSSNFSVGAFYSTEDGAATWTKLPNPPGAGSLRFLTQEDGWLVGGVGWQQLWFTHDAGRTWTEKSIQPPADCKACAIVFDALAFQNPRTGVLTATIDAPMGQESATYLTHDGGKSWKLSEVVEGWSACSVVDMHVVQVRSFGQQGFTVQIGEQLRAPENSAGYRSSGGISKIDFVDDSNGWMLRSIYGCRPGVPTPCSRLPDQMEQIELLSTTDGGSTVKVVTPLIIPKAPSGGAQKDTRRGGR